MPIIIDVIFLIVLLVGLILYLGTMFSLYPQRERLRHIGEQTFPDKYLPVLYVWPGSWCTPLAQFITFFRWFGAKSSVAVNQLARQELSSITYWLLIIHAVAQVCFLAGVAFVVITAEVLDIPPPWER